MEDLTIRTEIRKRCRNFLSITASRTEHMIRTNTVPSRPIDPIKIFEPAEYRRWWRSVIRLDRVQYANLTITFSDGVYWDLREGTRQYV